MYTRKRTTHRAVQMPADCKNATIDSKDEICRNYNQHDLNDDDE